MATHVSEAPRGGFHGFWVAMFAAVAILAVVGVGFAAGRNSAGSTPVAAGQVNPGYVRWMQAHSAQGTWMRGHMASIRWMQTHQTQWSWMTNHMGDIGYMHDHWVSGPGGGRA